MRHRTGQSLYQPFQLLKLSCRTVPHGMPTNPPLTRCWVSPLPVINTASVRIFLDIQSPSGQRLLVAPLSGLGVPRPIPTTYTDVGALREPLCTDLDSHSWLLPRPHSLPGVSCTQATLKHTYPECLPTCAYPVRCVPGLGINTTSHLKARETIRRHPTGLYQGLNPTSSYQLGAPRTTEPCILIVFAYLF